MTEEEMRLLDDLKSKLAKCNEQIEQHLASSTSGAAMNPAGDIGGVRSRSRKRRRQIFERYSKEAKEHIELLKRREDLKRRIAYIESSSERERRALQRDISLYRWWNSLKPGDTIEPGNNVLVITKKNAKSVVVSSGSRWTMYEVTGLTNDRVSYIKAYLKGEKNGNVGREVQEGN